MIFADDYYCWLLEKIGVLHGEYEQYLLLMQYLYSREYEYMLEMDSNRASGGLALRDLYATEAGIYVEDVKDGPCVGLEMLISMAMHMCDYTSIPVKDCFWELMKNLDLLQYTDDEYCEPAIASRIDIWLYRQYGDDGIGSLFPMSNDPIPGYSSMETWNQMHKYIVKNYPPGDWIK